MQRRYSGLMWFLFVPLSAAWGQAANVLDLKHEVVDLKYTVEDLGGATRDLEVKETETEIQIDLAADVLFEFDSAELQPQATEALQQAAAVIRERATGTVRIEGHTDSKGDDAYNQGLSERRANAVRDWFVNEGDLSDVSFVTRGLGESVPIAPNAKPDGADDPEGRQKNRRVEIRVEK
ncbi:MAG TPA: OmpA family protein [Gammaproteobacteria bacterium]|nr:OmpA family protein [Gammaproteobacteria bacterium]